MNNPQLRAASQHFTLTAATKLQVLNSSQTSPRVRSSPACLVNKPRLRATSGKQDGRDFNNRGGERGRQPISFRSCQRTDQKAAQVASAPPGQLSDLKTKLMVTRQKVKQEQSKVDQTQMRMAQSQDDPASQRRDEVGKLQEDRSKGRDRESHLRSNQSCGEGKCRGSELYRRSPRRQRRQAIQSNEQSD